VSTLTITDLSRMQDLSLEQLDDIRGGMASEHDLQQKQISGFLAYFAPQINPNYPYPADARTDEAR
jgi:hypothetical protein